jgi:hypothetical protein
MSTIETNGNEAMNEAEVASPLVSELESAEEEVPSPSKKIAKPAINVEVVIEQGGEVLLQETKTEDEEDVDEPWQETKAKAEREITDDSDLSHPDRRIWVVTTAALPWRTGTAVNPLMRALYLTRGRPKHHVTLLIPWLTDEKSRIKLYGAENAFTERGMDEQEEWIRDFCRTRAKCEGMVFVAFMSDSIKPIMMYTVVRISTLIFFFFSITEEEKNLRILFWEGTYNDSFGSIFPTVDICSLIPKAEADVAILEEPEHLNWFRNPASNSDTDEDVDVLGWAHKFNHVVGILHTNYGAYIRQYSMGTSLVTAPALNALSTLVVRAYCHKIIRLSATLTSFVPSKEVTSNVHGVRSEFLDPVEMRKAPTKEKLAPVYFIGKLIWAKGFDKVLELQENYRSKTDEYFPMDVYGGGNDEKAIRLAFFGRGGQPHSEDSASSTDVIESPTGLNDDRRAADIFSRDVSLRLQVSDDSASNTTEAEPAVSDANTDATNLELASHDDPPGAAYPESEGNVDDSASSTARVNPDVSDAQAVTERDAMNLALTTLGDPSGAANSESEGKVDDEAKSGAMNPALALLGDLSGRALSTGAQTADAAMKLVESVMEAGLGTFKEKDDQPAEAKSKSKVLPFKFVPPLATFKWRRTPIPARFLGVEDHILVRDIPEHKIFLNMSTTEVLCTTSAEALAMGKFLIVPKHRKLKFAGYIPCTHCGSR